MSLVTTDSASSLERRFVQRLIVTWQHPLSRAMFPVAVLEADTSAYSFEYLASARDVADFRPFIGFPSFDERYVAQELFPLFEERVMGSDRPDYERYVGELSLHARATPWEQLARSGGGSEGDTIQIYPAPVFEDGFWVCQFLVNGTRHLLRKSVETGDREYPAYARKGLETVLDDLKIGEPLEVVREPNNEFSETAMLVLTARDEPIGYVPNWLTEEVVDLYEDGLLRFTVEHVNEASAGWHLRVLSRLEISCDSEYQFFAGPTWALASQVA